MGEQGQRLLPAVNHDYYMGLYGWPADSEGLLFWSGKIEEAAGNFTAIKNAFASSREYEKYVFKNDAGEQRSYEEVVYNNLLGRNADEEGNDAERLRYSTLFAK